MSDGASCACLTVKWTTRRNADGSTSGWWACTESDDHRFVRSGVVRWLEAQMAERAAEIADRNCETCGADHAREEARLRAAIRAFVECATSFDDFEDENGHPLTNLQEFRELASSIRALSAKGGDK